jgi:hypothetical protein
MWVARRPLDRSDMANTTGGEETQIMQDQDLPVLEDYDVLANFEPLTELPQAVVADDSTEKEM